MIVGSGMIAKAFKEYEKNQNILIFAKGVSNSLETRKEEFEREATLLHEAIQVHQDKTFVYFGTCSALDSCNNYNAYIQHKIKMENIIKKNCKNYFIFRLPQVVGKTTSPTLVNFLSAQIKDGNHFYLWKNSKRNLIDVDDVFSIASYLINNDILKNQITNIASSNSISITSIVKKIEFILGKNANYTIEEKGSSYDIDISKVSKYLSIIKISFDGNYIDTILNKYVKL